MAITALFIYVFILAVAVQPADFRFIDTIR